MEFFFLSAGFEFSDCEPSALVQRQGGPCAVIAPVQAFLLKTILSESSNHNLNSVSVVMHSVDPKCASHRIVFGLMRHSSCEIYTNVYFSCKLENT